MQTTTARIARNAKCSNPLVLEQITKIKEAKQRKLEALLEVRGKLSVGAAGKAPIAQLRYDATHEASATDEVAFKVAKAILEHFVGAEHDTHEQQLEQAINLARRGLTGYDRRYKTAVSKGVDAVKVALAIEFHEQTGRRLAYDAG